MRRTGSAMTVNFPSEEPRSLPSGTVTFVFTDIEGSTARWDRDRGAMQDALRRHDAIMRSAVTRRAGHVFKTIGDAFCCAFARPQDAVAAIVDAQLALAAQDFTAIDGMHVRAALHTGTADERDADYFGPALNRVARLLAIGHGGQVLLSDVTRGLAHRDLPNGAKLVDLGLRRLKDLTDPEHVWQLCVVGLPTEFPALRSHDRSSADLSCHNLPQAMTSFHGRERELADLVRLIASHRLVTLTGAGGMGKTRLALEVALELVSASADGVWFVELAPLREATSLASAIAQTLGVREIPNQPALEMLAAYLKQKTLVLILDNCEHLVAEAARIAGAILRGCPGVRIVATSRELLRIAGERSYRLSSLTFPTAEPKDVLRPADANAYSAIALFVERAQAADHQFTLTDEDAPNVAEICRRLDGIPLAIELAAARVTILSSAQLRARLDERFRLLIGGSRALLPRQQTLRALIDWSYDLLSAREQRLFDSLSVFAGSCTLATAAAVCVPYDLRSFDASGRERTSAPIDEIEQLDLLELIASLVDKSLVVADKDNSEPRYRLLESFRQYGREKLAERSEQTAIKHRHASAFLQVAERLEETWDSVADHEWLPQAEKELENWRAALEWALAERGDVALGQRLVGALRPAWQHFALMEGRRWVCAAQAQVDDSTPLAVVAKLQHAEAFIAELFGEYESALAAGELALTAYRELGDPRGTVAMLRVVGSCLLVLRRGAEGEALLQEALVAARVLGTRQIVGWIFAGLAFARSLEDDIAGARVFYAEARRLFVALGSERAAAMIALHLAETECRAGDQESAVRLARDALATSRVLNQTRDVMAALACMSSYLILLGQFAEAGACAREGLNLAYERGWSAAVAFSVQHLVAIAVLQQPGPAADTYERWARGARLLGFVDARIAELKAAWEYSELQERDRVLAVLRDAIDTADLADLMTSGAIMTLDRAVEEALDM